MMKFVVFTALVACVYAAPGNLVVPAAPVVATPLIAAHAVAVHPVATSYHNTYRAPVVKAAPVLVKTPVIAPIIHAAPAAIVKTAPVIAAPAFIKTAPIIAAPAVAVAHAPVAVATATSYHNTYKAPLLKHVVAAAPVVAIH